MHPAGRNLAVVSTAGALVWLALGPAIGGAGQPAPADPNWNRRPPGVGDYPLVTEVSGRSELALFFHRPPALDLGGPCAARQEAIEIAIPTTEAYLAGLLAEPPGRRDEREIAWTRYRLGQLWSHEGLMDRAAAQFEEARRIAAARGDGDPEFAHAALLLESTLGITHLRRGELENCLHDHHATSCIFPLADEARHRRTSGSEQAIDHFLRYLERRPDDLEIRWLLNVAAMTLGKHPDGVPARFVIPPEAFASAENPGRFVDVAGPAGLGRPGRAGGTIVDDFTNNGLFDVVVSSADPCEPLRFYRNEGDGTFSDRTAAAGLSGQLGGINIVQADYDNDGWLDLFVMRGGWEYPMRNSLLRNNGDGTFTDVTERAGLASALHRTHSAAWADFDNDGWLDLFVGHEETPAALYRNRGDGTFENVAREAGVARATFTKGAVWGDVTGSGYPDLYVSNYGEPNLLYRNNGDGTFTERAASLGVEKPIMSFPAWFWDYDNDGRLDLFVANYIPSITDIVRGFLDLPRQAETLKLYRSTGNGRFQDVTEAVGLDRVVPTMAANFGDIDNSGAQDIFANMGGFVTGDTANRVLFRNPGHGNNWIQIRLIGVKTNRAAIGANVTVVLDSGRGRGGDRTIRYREVTSGGSFGASPLMQHIGLGKASRIEAIEVVWPASGSRQRFENVGVNQRIEITEFEESYVRKRLDRLPL